MRSSLLVKLFGFRATLCHGDTAVLDRWRWLTRRLPRTGNNEALLDVGCGTGPFSTYEDGWHLRRGYTRQMLEELCAEAGLRVEAVSYCTGFLSQKITGLLRTLSRVHDLLGWAAVLPLRPLPPVFDRLVTPLIG